MISPITQGMTMPYYGKTQGTQKQAQPNNGDENIKSVQTDEIESRNKRLAAGCRTCASRKYKDGSNDPGVSFKSATAVKPQSAGVAVMAHEQEHVTREKQKANQEGRQVVSQSITLHMGICSECHKPFVSGGTTRTTTASVKQKYTQIMGNTQNSKPIFSKKI